MSTTVGSDNYVGLEPFFIQEGLAYRITPFNFRKLGLAQNGFAVDSETMYENLMNRFEFGGMSTPGIYIDETITRMGYTHRRLYTMLANQLIREGKRDKALAVLNKCDEEFPASILRLGKGTCYVSEGIAKPFASWHYGIEDKDVSV
jgi:hypothetical protein